MADSFSWFYPQITKVIKQLKYIYSELLNIYYIEGDIDTSIEL